MKSAPFTLSEAKKICEEYQYLVGQRFCDDNAATIECVAVSPFDQLNKSRFIIYYLLLNDAGTALTNEYQGPNYDVIVMTGCEDMRELFHEDIDTWLKRNKLFDQALLEDDAAIHTTR